MIDAMRPYFESAHLDARELDVLIGWEEAPEEYTAPHDLQVVELILTDGERLIDGLYSSLWQEAE